MDDFDTLRELLNARFDSLEARITQIYIQLEKENERQDVAIERVADRAAPVSEFNRLMRVVETLEREFKSLKVVLGQIQYRVRVTWAVGTGVAGVIVAILTAYALQWVGG